MQPDQRFDLDGRDLRSYLDITPWEAALGATVPLKLMDGKTASLNIKPGARSGSRMKLKGRGMPARGKKKAGDLFAELRIVVPEQLSEQDRDLFEKLAETSEFNPRAA